MTKDLKFITNSIFKSLIYDKDSESWCFYFADNIYIQSTGFWRIFHKNKIIFVSLDNGTNFGRLEKYDLKDEIEKLLKEKKLLEIRVDKNTADLVLSLSEDIKVEILISSCGYETYNFNFANNRYIGLGSGEIGIVEKTDNPQIFTTRQL